MELTWFQILLLTLSALGAGIVDAIAGGGGLITLPALLTAGLPPQLALGTNKGQSVFGSGAAMLRFWKGRAIDPVRARLAFPLGLGGALVGAALVLCLRPEVLRPVVLVMLPLAAVVVVLRPGGGRRIAWTAAWPRLTAALIAFGVAIYDGFFGPGTGTFLILGFVALLGSSPLEASADAKVVNFASNLAAVSLFASRGVVLWRIALPMAAAQAVGGFLGAHWTLKLGDRLVRAVVLVVVAALMVKLSADAWAAR